MLLLLSEAILHHYIFHYQCSTAIHWHKYVSQWMNQCYFQTAGRSHGFDHHGCTVHILFMAAHLVYFSLDFVCFFSAFTQLFGCFAILSSVLWCCYLCDKKGMCPVKKVSASKLLVMDVNVSGWGTAGSAMRIQRASACHVRILGIRLTGDWESRRQLANPG